MAKTRTYKDRDISFSYTVTEHPEASSFRLHAHDSLEIYYFIGGGASYLVEGTEYKLRPKDVLIMRTSEVHRVIINSGHNSYERMSINFSPELYKEAPELLAPFYGRPLGKFNRYRRESFRSDLYRLALENLYMRDEPLENRRLNLYSNLTVFLLELKAAFDSAERETGVEEYMGTELLSYVNDNIFSDISLSDLSERFYLSKTHLNRRFKLMTGSTLYNYVKIKRLIAAREEIRRGASATDAAKSCGYNDYSAFYRAYTARFGISPNKDKSTG